MKYSKIVSISFLPLLVGLALWLPGVVHAENPFEKAAHESLTNAPAKPKLATGLNPFEQAARNGTGSPNPFEQNPSRAGTSKNPFEAAAANGRSAPENPFEKNARLEAEEQARQDAIRKEQERQEEIAQAAYEARHARDSRSSDSGDSGLISAVSSTESDADRAYQAASAAQNRDFARFAAQRQNYNYSAPGVQRSVGNYSDYNSGSSSSSSSTRKSQTNKNSDTKQQASGNSAPTSAKTRTPMPPSGWANTGPHYTDKIDKNGDHYYVITSHSEEKDNYSTCPKCGGAGCAECGWQGWILKSTDRRNVPGDGIDHNSQTPGAVIGN